MTRDVMLIMISNRSNSAVKVQDLLTEYGCIIKTRLGLHEGVDKKCSESGLIILEIFNMDSEAKKLLAALKKVKGVHAKYVQLEVK